MGVYRYLAGIKDSGGKFMKLGAKNLEWLFVVTLVIIAITEFLMFGGGVLSSTIQTSMIVMGLLMIFAGQVINSIILLRIYDKMSESASKL